MRLGSTEEHAYKGRRHLGVACLVKFRRRFSPLKNESRANEGTIVDKRSLSSWAWRVNEHRALENRGLLCRDAEYHLRSRFATRLGVGLESKQGDNYWMEGGCCMPGEVQERRLLLENEPNVKRGTTVGKKSLSSGA